MAPCASLCHCSSFMPWRLVNEDIKLVAFICLRQFSYAGGHVVASITSGVQQTCNIVE